MISIHAPRRGSDANRQQKKQFQIFQSTLPAGGATRTLLRPRKRTCISIHAPRRGSADVRQVPPIISVRFQSTLPAGGATEPPSVTDSANDISIHAPRRGSDDLGSYIHWPQFHFNPRSPQGERRAKWWIWQHSANFNPRSPQGERPVPVKVQAVYTGISIHAPRRGSDYSYSLLTVMLGDFNPRSPQGERLASLC